MLLWDIIRSWFVQYVFGGTLLDAEGNLQNFTPSAGFLSVYEGNGEWFDEYFGSICDVQFVVGTRGDGMNYNINLGDWLSTTATLIVLIAVCVGLFFLVRYFFRMFAGLLSGR